MKQEGCHTMIDYTIVKDENGLNDALDAIGTSQCALDFETTSLDPTVGRVRLVTLCNDTCRYLVDFDGIEGGFNAVAHYFQDGTWIVFNAGFEQRWFLHSCPDVPITCWDVGHLRRAIQGGGRFGLKDMAKWDLNIEMDKTQQNSAWQLRELSSEQLDYAFLDAEITWKLWRVWWPKADHGHRQGFDMLNDMVPAVHEMENAGIDLDVKTHGKLVARWEKMKAERVKTLRELVTEDEVANINSGPQWSDFLVSILPDDIIEHWPKTEKTGQLETSVKVLKTMAGSFLGTPLEAFFTALSEYKTIEKYITSFGENLITIAAMNGGKIYASYHIGAARTLRLSCSGPNLQQTPRDRDFFGEEISVRSAFVAPAGHLLASLDYSGIELRTLALLSGDEQLLFDMIHGDVHLEMGSFMAGRRLDKSVVADSRIRQDAKGVSFGVVYGIGAPGLAATMKTPVYEAEKMIDYWATRYAKAFNYRFEKSKEVADTKSLRCAGGNTIWMGERADLPKLANYPVQGGALALMAKAIVRHHDNLNALPERQRQGIVMVATIHDALIDRATTKLAPLALELMNDAMTQGFLDVFPGASTERLVEGGVGKNWGALK